MPLTRCNAGSRDYVMPYGELKLLVERDGPFHLTAWNGLTTVQQRVPTAAVKENGTALASQAVTPYLKEALKIATFEPGMHEVVIEFRPGEAG
jgi:hypothetical protein